MKDKPSAFNIEIEIELEAAPLLEILPGSLPQVISRSSEASRNRAKDIPRVERKRGVYRQIIDFVFPPK